VTLPTPRTTARYNSAAQTIPGSVNTIVQFDSSDTSAGQPSIYLANINYAAGTFTCNSTQAVTMLVTWQIGWQYFNVGQRATWLQYGGDSGNRYGYVSQLSTNTTPFQAVATVVTMQPGDSFTIMCYQDAPSASITTGGNLDGVTGNRANRIQITQI
jgi:hypothetical protein